MKYTKKKIYDLLPAIYRQRDLENGSPLKALLGVIAEQIRIVEDDIEGLYENWFIETCDECLVPYKADQIHARILYPVSNATNSQRAWVANTIGYRRRKGTLAVLEQLARDVTGWDAKAIEFFELLITTQYLNHLRQSNLSTAGLRDIERLDRLSTPFNTIFHTLDVRSIRSQRGYYNIPNIGIFFWRLRSLPAVNAPAFNHGDGKFSFNRLGYDEPLFNHVRLEKGSAGVAEEINISAPIRMFAMDESLSQYYYDSINEDSGQKSIEISVNGSVRNISEIIVCNLADWVHRPPPKKVALDPVLGRILFPIHDIPESVHTRHYYGFSSEIGGGFYIRPRPSSDLADSKDPTLYKISKNTVSGDGSTIYATVHDAITKWAGDSRKNAVFEILDSEFYDESALVLEIPSEIKLVIRSKQEEQPVLRLASPLTIKGDKGSGVIFDGLLFDTVREDGNDNNNLLNILRGDLGSLTLRHCTLVPGRSKDTEYDSKFLFNWNNIPTNPADMTRLRNFLFQNFEVLKWVNDPATKFELISDKILKISNPAITTGQFLTVSLDGKLATLETNSNDVSGEPAPAPERIYDFTINETDAGEINIYNPKVSVLMTAAGTNENLVVSLDSTICGRVLLTQSEAKVKLNTSIVDGKGSNNALTCYKSTMEGGTIFGTVDLFILELASNVIFTDTITVKRIQLGCVRFCYVPGGSQTPRRYHCQPEYFNATKLTLSNDTGDVSLNLLPRFTSTIYGDPGYAQLHKNIATPIFEGGDNGSEIGVFNHLYQAQRIKNIKLSLDEYLRFGLELGIFLET